MTSPSPRKSLLCPNCRKLISGSAPSCPFCGLKNPASKLKNNAFTRGLGDRNQWVTLLIAVNVILFIFSVAINPMRTGLHFSPFSFLSPSSQSLFVLGSTGSIPVFQYHRWWTLLSANFLHGGLLHLVFNMLALRQLLPLVMEEFGTYRTIIIYILSGVLGFAISALAGVQLTIGASASLCGLIGALLYYGKSRGGVYGKMVFSQIGGWAIAIGVFGLMVPGINNWGHGGGAVAGVIVAMALGYRERKRENYTHRFLALVCTTCTLLALIWSCIGGMLFLLFAR